MKTADELTALTLDFLSEHTNEAALAVVLGVVWHVIWERPKHLPPPFLNDATRSDESDAIEESLWHRTNSTDPRPPRKPTGLLRGNLRNELQLVLEENEQLDRLVRELRSEIERSDQLPTLGSSMSFFPTPVAHYDTIGFGPPPTAVQASRKRIRGDGGGGIARYAVGRTTAELDLLGSCWGILVFGFCLLSSKRTRRRRNPLAATIETLEAGTLAAHAFVNEDAMPALAVIFAYFDVRRRAFLDRALDPTSSTGKLVASSRDRFRAAVDRIESLLYDGMLPVAARCTQRANARARDAINAVASVELPSSREDLMLLLRGKKRPPTIPLSEHDETLTRVRESLEREISGHRELERETSDRYRELERKTSDLRKALAGKEALLYEERMKTRSARSDATRVALEREETRRLESEATRTTALTSVAGDQKRLLRGFLSEHILSKQQQDRLRRIDERINPKKTSTIVLPDPILQGFASAMYLNNISDLSSENTPPPSAPAALLNPPWHGPKTTKTKTTTTMDCRDDCNNTNSGDDDYYGNPNETRLKELREAFLRSKVTARTLRPSSSPSNNNMKSSTAAVVDRTGSTRIIDDAIIGARASTGSLLWSAASDPLVTKTARDDTASSKRLREGPTTSGSGPSALTLTRLATPSSWMEDPASLMCDWRTGGGNDDEARE